MVSPSPLPARLCVVGSCTEASSRVTALWPAFQEAVFDKNTGNVVLKTFSLYRKLLSLSRVGHDEGGEHTGPRAGRRAVGIHVVVGTGVVAPLDTPHPLSSR